ncbi:hypothetical protein [Niallia circulans]|uniref:hypothetical protein n=1 Tax=Niallia circulans TaxID=1397 RepID=UPI001F249E12|nr:hypothetical protein [Niallia circulans]MCF2650589.1 hypothetical protein [Niallia circulans]
MDLKFMTQDEREKLYDEVWNKPLAEIAKKYKVSEATMRKHLKRLIIPLPPRGHWQKIINGESVQRIDLPPVSGILKKYIRNYVIKHRTDIDALSEAELSSKEELHLLRAETKSYIIEKCSNIEIGNHLRNPHQLISKHKEETQSRAKRVRELKRTQKNFSQTSKIIENDAILPIHVSRPNLNRAYRILDTIIKTLDDMEGKVRVETKDNQDTAYFFIIYTTFQFELNEKDSKLVLKISANDWMSFNNKSKVNLEFKDMNELPLEKQVGKIIYRMFVIANNFFADYKMEERSEKREQEERERQRRLEQARKGELEKIKQLSQAVADWDKARKIREFADDMEFKVQGISDISKREKLLNWVKWARDKADWIDPLADKDDELLGKSVSLIDLIYDSDDI